MKLMNSESTGNGHESSIKFEPPMKFNAFAKLERSTYKTEHIKTEPLKTEPIKTEPLETEPLETEPLETEPLETESIMNANRHKTKVEKFKIDRPMVPIQELVMKEVPKPRASRAEKRVRKAMVQNTIIPQIVVPKRTETFERRYPPPLKNIDFSHMTYEVLDDGRRKPTITIAKPPPPPKKSWAVRLKRVITLINNPNPPPVPVVPISNRRRSIRLIV